MKKLTVKMILEFLAIPACIAYLYYLIFNNHLKANVIVMSIVIFFTLIELLVKYIKEVYTYENKNNIFKVIFIIFCVLLLVVTILNLFLKYSIINTLFMIGTVLLLIFLLYLAITSLINMKKEKGYFYQNGMRAFFSLISFSLIIIGFILNTLK